MAERRAWRGIIVAVATVAGAGLLGLLGAGVIQLGGGPSESYEPYSPPDDDLAAENAASAIQNAAADAPAPAPSPASGGTYGPFSSTDSGDGALLVDNRCDRAVRASFAYRSGGGWQLNNGAEWDIPGFQFKYPSVDDRALRPDSTEIYIQARTLDDAFIWRGAFPFAAGGRSFDMRLAGVTEDDAGRKIIVLECGQAQSR